MKNIESKTQGDSSMRLFKNDKEKLMGLLDDPNVQKKIRHIASPMQNYPADSGKTAIEDKGNIPTKAMESYTEAPTELEKKRGELTSVLKDKKVAQENLLLAQNEARTLGAKVNDLKEKNLNLTDQLASVKQDNADAQTKCKQLSSQYNSTRTELDNVRGKLQQYESSMSEFNKIFDLYNALHDRVKDGLQGVFNNSSLRAFIICGVQKDNLFTLWDYCKTEFDRGKLEAHDSLLAIFEFFFNLVKQSVSGTFLYEIQTVSIGEAFNKDLHTVAGMGIANGKITSVILPGIVYATNQKIFKKSLVAVR